jgi:DNA repair exonuclease SbcCD ATPase subunit
MRNDFTDYYKTVHEHANDLVNEIFDDMVEEMKENYGLRLETFLSWKDSTINEYNNYMSISLREAVEILEQSNRLCSDSAMYVGAGDCREQVQVMAYWTYRNDLLAEFRIALQERLSNEIPAYNEEVDRIQQMMDEIEEEIESKESQIEQFEEEKEIAEEEEKSRTVKAIESSIQQIEVEIDKLKQQFEKLEEEYEEPSNLLVNAESMLGEF